MFRAWWNRNCKHLWGMRESREIQKGYYRWFSWYQWQRKVHYEIEECIHCGTVKEKTFIEAGDWDYVWTSSGY